MAIASTFLNECEPTSITRTGVPAMSLLISWQSFAWSEGVQMDHLAACDRLIVLTLHSTYEIVVVAPAEGKVLVRGGQFFRDFTPVRLTGATLGGSFVKVRTVHIGFRMEFDTGRGCVLTSPAKTIALAASCPQPQVL
jgi:hypothetical protein